MEIFRMGFYVMLPIGMFYYFGLPDFYKEHVIPAFKKVYPDDMPLQKTVPTTPEENRQLLEELVAKRRQRQQQQQAAQQQE